MNVMYALLPLYNSLSIAVERSPPTLKLVLRNGHGALDRLDCGSSTRHLLIGVAMHSCKNGWEAKRKHSIIC